MDGQIKIAAIYNVFDGLELLKHSIGSIKDHVNYIVIIYQSTSNFGEVAAKIENEIIKISHQFPLSSFFLYEFIPTQLSGQPNEIKKRQLGIDKAKELGCTHFIAMDCDEVYEDFKKAKELYFNSGVEGSVCAMWTYFKEPTLRFEKPEGYYVPFIHKLTPETVTGVSNYSYYCDRTRQINTNNVVLLPIFMHHFSWVRRDIMLKLRNSSAKRNRNLDEWAADYNNPDVKEGFYVKDFQQKLVKVDNIFNIQI